MKLKNFMEDFQPKKGSTVKIPVGGVVSEYRQRYEALKKDSNRRFHHDVYILRPGDIPVVHVKVPSESIKTEPFYYDVLIQLEPDPDSISFRDCNVRVFSNCPSYVYSGLGYIHSHWNTEEKGGRPSMMIDSLKGKLPRQNLLVKGSEKRLGYRATHKEPVVRNPMGLPIFDKSLYYAVFYIEDNLSLLGVKSSHHYVSQGQMVASVASFDHLMAERKRAERRDRERQNRDKHRNRELFKLHEEKVEEESRRNANGTLRPKSASTMTRSSPMVMRGPRTTRSPRSTTWGRK